MNSIAAVSARHLLAMSLVYWTFHHFTKHILTCDAEQQVNPSTAAAASCLDTVLELDLSAVIMPFRLLPAVLSSR